MVSANCVYCVVFVNLSLCICESIYIHYLATIHPTHFWWESRVTIEKYGPYWNKSREKPFCKKTAFVKTAFVKIMGRKIMSWYSEWECICAHSWIIMNDIMNVIVFNLRNSQFSLHLCHFMNSGRLFSKSVGIAVSASAFFGDGFISVIHIKFMQIFITGQATI